MVGSSFKGKKQLKVILVIVIINIGVTSIQSGRAAIIADWGDVVDVNYSLWTDAAHTQPVTGNIDKVLPYICLVKGQTVPPEVLALFPDATSSLLENFKEELIGLELNKDKDFIIPSTEHPYPGELQGKNLYYRVRLIKMWYDASGGEGQTTTRNNRDNPLESFDSLIIMGGGIVIFVAALLYYGSTTQKRKEKSLGQESTSTSLRARSIKQKKTQLKELRELAEQRGTIEVIDEEKTSDVKFRRRR